MDHTHCQFPFLQEHWLSDTQHNDIGILNANYLSTGLSCLNNIDVLSDLILLIDELYRRTLSGGLFVVCLNIYALSFGFMLRPMSCNVMFCCERYQQVIIIIC